MLKSLDGYFVDDDNRITILRGCSLAGSKLPSSASAPNEHRQVSYANTPFPLEEADDHFTRLRGLGFNCLRLVVPWEALEHEGPGIYDETYMKYLAPLVKRMESFGLICMIDIHQDLWSRLCGGSGAPGWTLELAGFDISAFNDVYAAHAGLQDPDPRILPPSAWPSGYQKMATATMFTLFFAGDDFAPLLQIPISQHGQAATLFSGMSDDSTVGAGTFLRRSMIAAYARLANVLQNCPNVLGIEVLNEPHRGYLELHSFYQWNEMTDLAFSYFPSTLQGMALGDGIAQTIPVYSRWWPQPTAIHHYEDVRPKRSVWRDGCLWRKHGVWDQNSKGQPVVLRHSYFNINPRTNRPIEFYHDCWFPFVNEFANALQADPTGRRWLIFCGGIPNELPPPWPVELRPRNLVYAPHFYDLHTLFGKTFGNVTFNVQGLSRGMNPLKAIYIGQLGAKENYTLQTRNLMRPDMTNYFSEIGTTYEANLPSFHSLLSRPLMTARRKRTHRHSRWQTRQLDALLAAMERNAVAGYAIWNYLPQNDAHSEIQIGDQGDAWNGEDFSFAYTPPGSGQVNMRCLAAIVRPYPIKIAGRKPQFSYDAVNLEFTFSFCNPEDGQQTKMRESEIFLPSDPFALGQVHISVSDGEAVYQPETQTITWKHQDDVPLAKHWLKIHVTNNEERNQRRKRFKNIDLDMPITFGVLLALVIAILAAVFTGCL